MRDSQPPDAQEVAEMDDDRTSSLRVPIHRWVQYACLEASAHHLLLHRGRPYLGRVAGLHGLL